MYVQGIFYEISHTFSKPRGCYMLNSFNYCLGLFLFLPVLKCWVQLFDKPESCFWFCSRHLGVWGELARHQRSLTHHPSSQRWASGCTSSRVLNINCDFLRELFVGCAIENAIRYYTNTMCTALQVTVNYYNNRSELLKRKQMYIFFVYTPCTCT